MFPNTFIKLLVLEKNMFTLYFFENFWDGSTAIRIKNRQICEFTFCFINIYKFLMYDLSIRQQIKRQK